jgi:hypothetical protein
MPRCGGSSVRWSIMRAGYEYKFSCEHAHIDSLPLKYKNIPTVGFIRSPIDWYLSWYYFLKTKRNNRAGCFILSVLSDNYDLPFEYTLPRMLDVGGFLKDNPQYIEKIKEKFKMVVMNHYLCWLNTYFDDISEVTYSDFEGSLFNWYYKKVGLHQCKEIYRMEDGLQNGIDRAFPDKNIVINHQNQSNKPIVDHIYTDELKQMVINTDKEYFIKHGYTF